MYIAQTFLILAIIGALNWGLVGLLNFNLVSSLFGTQTLMSRLVYGIVGLSGIITIYYYFIFHGIQP